MSKPNTAEPVDRLAELTAQLAEGVAAIQDSESFKAWLNTAAHFPNYSWGNQLLIGLQRPDATRVAGYRTWLKLGRQVRKGETGIRILAPCVYRIRAEAETDPSAPLRAGLETTSVVLPGRPRGFRSVSVFDISQTEGPDLPSVDVPLLEGEFDECLYTRLADFARCELGIRVTNDDPAGDGLAYQGYYQPHERLIFVRPASPLQMAKTLIHEVSHALDLELLTSSPKERETVAEGTAYIVCTACGYDTATRSFPYIAGWAGRQDGAEVLKRCMHRIQTGAARLLSVLKPDVTPVEEVAA